MYGGDAQLYCASTGGYMCCANNNVCCEVCVYVRACMCVCVCCLCRLPHTLCSRVSAAQATKLAATGLAVNCSREFFVTQSPSLTLFLSSHSFSLSFSHSRHFSFSRSLSPSLSLVLSLSLSLLSLSLPHSHALTHASTFCCDKAAGYPDRCCPRWTVCCTAERFGCCSPSSHARATGLSIYRDMMLAGSKQVCVVCVCVLHVLDRLLHCRAVWMLLALQPHQGDPPVLVQVYDAGSE
jgi:hypothetical protein